ncbi:MAG: hypothetical protein OXK77_02960 [Gemmatimonadota bacterium]|nr:hypothetical protein [Gemmatimonadota bacterium]MDE2864126.1 hypothetical protein [Gemmatimonadota bacterium]
MRALTGIAVSLSLLVVSVVEAYHSHEDEAESAAECSECLLGKTPGHTTGSHTPGLTVPSLFRAPAIAGHGPAPTDLHIAPHRSRAPPLSVSL